MAYMENKKVENGETYYHSFWCNNHIRGNTNLFCNLNKCFWYNVKIGNYYWMSVMGKGNVKV